MAKAAKSADLELDGGIQVVLEPNGSDDDEIEVITAPEKLDADTPDPVKALETQLEAMRAAEKINNDKLQEAERSRREAQQLADSRATEIDRVRAESQDVTGELLVNALKGAQSEQEAAELEYAKAAESIDTAAMAKANGKIARAAAKVIHYEASIGDYDTRKKAQPERTERQQPEQVDPLTAIERNPNLLSTEKDWLKQHQDAFIDAGRNRELGVAYDRATRQGLKRGTTEYFNYLDEFMGYKQPEQKADSGNGRERPSIVSAPVTRESRSMTNQPTKPSQVRLTPAQQQLADDAGLTYAEYAKGLMQMDSDKRANPEKYSNGAR